MQFLIQYFKFASQTNLEELKIGSAFLLEEILNSDQAL